MSRARVVIVVIMLIWPSPWLARFDSRGHGISTFFAGQERGLDRSLCPTRSCGSTALADSVNSGGPGTIGRREGTCREAERVADHEVDQAFSQSLGRRALRNQI